MNPAPSKMHYVYLLKGDKDKWVYVGLTSDLKKRMDGHRSGKSTYTSKYLPVRLVYYEAYASVTDARNREKRLKQYGNSLYSLRSRIKNSLIEEGAG